jgi:hypothetical protein
VLDVEIGKARQPGKIQQRVHHQGIYGVIDW